MPQADEVVNSNGQEQVNNEGAKPVGQPADSQSPKPQAQSGQNPDPAPGNKGGMTDRERGFVTDLQKERTARQQLEKQIADLNSNLERERKRIRLMFEDDPQSAEEQEVAAIRQQFAKVFPGLAKLTDDQIDRLLQSTESAESAQTVVDHHWTSHARQTLDSVIDSVSEVNGSDLTARQKQRVEGLFIQFVESNEVALKRYMAGDKKLIEEFVKDYTEDFITPARRQTTNQEVSRFRPVPRSGDRSNRPQTPKKIDFNDPKAVEDAMVASYREHGGTFKR